MSFDDSDSRLERLRHRIGGTPDHIRVIISALHGYTEISGRKTVSKLPVCRGKSVSDAAPWLPCGRRNLYSRDQQQQNSRAASRSDGFQGVFRDFGTGAKVTGFGSHSG